MPARSSTSSDQRKAQLRKAQQRSRQRKLDALHHANQQVELLQARLHRAGSIVSTLLRADHSLTKADLTTITALLNCSPEPDAASADQTEVKTSSKVSQSLISQHPQSSSADSSPPSQSWLSIEDATAFDSPALVYGEPLDSYSPFFSAPISLSEDFLPSDHFPAGSDLNASDASSTASFSAAQPSLSTTFLPLTTLAHFELTFTRRLYRRSLENLYTNLSNPHVNLDYIERVLGNTLGYVTPSYILHKVAAALKHNQFEPIEFFYFPEFQLPRLDMIGQDRVASVRSPIPGRPYDSEAEHRNRAQPTGWFASDDPFLSPQDIQNWGILRGFFVSETGSDGQPTVTVAPFEHSGATWIIDEEQFITGLLTVGRCIGKHPSFVQSDVIRLIFQSMRRTNVKP